MITNNCFGTYSKRTCCFWRSNFNAFSQEEDLQEIVAKISSKRVEFDEARAQMAELKAAYEKAEQEYKQHKELINTAVEEADVKKVATKLTPVWLVLMTIFVLRLFSFKIWKKCILHFAWNFYK